MDNRVKDKAHVPLPPDHITLPHCIPSNSIVELGGLGLQHSLLTTKVSRENKPSSIKSYNYARLRTNSTQETTTLRNKTPYCFAKDSNFNRDNLVNQSSSKERSKLFLQIKDQSEL